MANFTDTFDESRNLVEVEFQNGRDVKPSELNEAQRIERVLRRRTVQALRNSTNSFNGDGFRIIENSGDNVNKVRVQQGTGFVGGEVIRLDSDLVLSGLTTPGAPRVDEIYVEVREVERTDADFPNIGDPDIGQTATRLQLSVSLHVIENGVTPSSSGDLHSGGILRVKLATLNRDANNTVTTAEITDERPLISYPVPLGGTGVSSFDAGDILIGAGGSNPINTVNTPLDDQIYYLRANGFGGDPSWDHPVPIGTVIDWFRASGAIPIPDGWQFCDGSSITDLRSPINGFTTPDLRDKFVRGKTTTASGTTSGGSDTVNLQHSHTVNSHTHSTPTSGLPTTTDPGEQFNMAVYNNGSVLASPGHFAVDPGNTSEGSHRHQSGGNTGSSAPGTNNSLSTSQTVVPAYVGLIKLLKIY